MSSERVRSFNVGDIQVDVVLCDTDAWNLDPLLSEFISPGEPEAQLRLWSNHEPRFEAGKIFFESGSNWRLYDLPDRRVIHLHRGIVGSNEVETHAVGIFSKDFLSGDVYFMPSATGQEVLADPLSRPMGDLYFIHLLGQERGALLHSCGIGYEQNGYIFAGVGDAGKSTTARLWEARGDCVILSDDRVILRQQENGFHIYGTPWPGTSGIANPGKFPLRALYFLAHGSVNRARPLRPAEVVTRLMRASFLARWDYQAITYSLALFDRLAQQVPGYELSFTPDDQAVAYVREHAGRVFR